MSTPADANGKRAVHASLQDHLLARAIEIHDGLVRLGQQLEELRRDTEVIQTRDQSTGVNQSVGTALRHLLEKRVGDQLSSSGHTSATVGSVSVSRIRRIVARGERRFP